MPQLLFRFPAFPLLGRFSDPSHDFDGMEEELAELAAKPPAELTSMDFYLLFNSFLPAGNFEEMIPYLPYAFALLQDDNGLYSNEAPDAAPCELLESLMTWCYVEEKELNRHPQLRDAVQEAFMSLFLHWTENTHWHSYSDGRLDLLNRHLVDSLLDEGDNLVACHQLTVYPWLLAAHYLPRLAELGSTAHAAWLLWLSDSEHRRFRLPPHDFPPATRRRAAEMVESWLHRPTATPEELQLWSPVLHRHRERLAQEAP